MYSRDKNKHFFHCSSCSTPSFLVLSISLPCLYARAAGRYTYTGLEVGVLYSKCQKLSDPKVTAVERECMQVVVELHPSSGLIQLMFYSRKSHRVSIAACTMHSCRELTVLHARYCCKRAVIWVVMVGYIIRRSCSCQ